MERFPLAVIFDFDGVLINSKPLHFSSLCEVLHKEKITLREEEYYQDMLGLSDRDTFKLIYQRKGQALDPGTLLRVMTRKNEVMMEQIYRNRLKALPGVEEFVRGLWRQFPLGICSGARREEIEALLTGIALRDCFKVIVSADDCAIGKPDPAGYLQAMRQLDKKARPGQCLIVEDSPVVVSSVKKAGFKVLAVTNSVGREKLQEADWVCDNLWPRTIAGVIPQLHLPL